MKRLLTALALCFAMASAGAAQDAHDRARGAALADVGTTGLGLALGAAELNPLGPVLSVGVKALVLRNIAELPQEQRAENYAAVSAIWGGAAANNLCVIAALVTGGSFTPVCIAIGVAWGLKTWKDTEHERIFWAEGCPLLRQYVGNPDLECVYTPPPAQAVAVAPNPAADPQLPGPTRNPAIH